MQLFIDLFTGSGNFEKVCRSYGFECVSFDIRRRAGVCEPSIKVDLLDLPNDFFTSMRPFFFYIAFPCTIFSNASGNFHIDNDFTPKTKLAVNHFELFDKVIEFLNQNPNAYFMFENPRGKFKKYLDHKKPFKNVELFTHLVTLDSYGFPTKKPTHFITNYPDLKFKKPSSFGRGAKNKNGISMNRLTVVQKQSTPVKFYESLFRQISKSAKLL